jgi:MoaA/NifB/PqqE/SkfB family radical SAM enzyme
MQEIQQAHGALPRSVMIELTNECQLACTTCPRDKIFAKDYDIGTMSLANFKHIFSQFEQSIHTLDLTGLGESLMHPDIFQIIRWVRSRREVHIYLTTNTILLNETNIHKLDEDPVDTLCVSVDGVSNDQLRNIRGLKLDPLRKRVRRAIAALRPRCEFILCTVLVEENIRDMVRFVELAAELGIERLSLKPLNLVATAIPSSYYRRYMTDDYLALAAEAVSVGESLGVSVQVFKIGTYSCTFPWDPLYVTWDGFLVPCCAKPFPKRMHFGNLLERSIHDILGSAQLKNFRDELVNSPKGPSFCSKCHIMNKTMFADEPGRSAAPILS